MTGAVDHRWEAGDFAIAVTAERGTKLMIEVAVPDTKGGAQRVGFTELTSEEAEALGHALLRAAALRAA